MEQMLNNAARESQANPWTIRLKVSGVVLFVCLVSSSLDLSGFSREWGNPLGLLLLLLSREVIVTLSISSEAPSSEQNSVNSVHGDRDGVAASARKLAPVIQ